MHLHVDFLTKSLLVLKFAFVMYAAAIGALWASVRLLSPERSEFSLLRGIGAAFLLAIAGYSLHRYLEPVFGGWYLLIALVAYVAIVKISFSLTIGRSALAAAIYFGVVAAVYHF